MKRGRRETFLVFDERTQQHIEAENCLFRTPTRGRGDAALGSVSEAYWPIPGRQPMKTIMGHVEFCYVITRSTSGRNGGGNNNSDDDSSIYSDDSSSDDDDIADDDIVFSLTRRLVAVKVNYGRMIEHYRGRHAEDPLQELACMLLVGNEHPHIMGVIDHMVDSGNLNVVMPYANNGDLFEMLQRAEQTGSRWPEDRARFWFRQLIEGVRHLHDTGVCHRDLSPENVMMDDQNCLIIDMGMALRVPYTDPNNPGGATNVQAGGTERRLMRPQGTAGKLPYMSPEIYANRQPFDGPTADIWTLGTILFCMVTGNRSYGRPEKTDPQFYWMSHALGKLVQDWEIHLSADCIDLLSKMMTINPRMRATLDEVRDHPWVRNGGVDDVNIGAMAIDG
jgi:serine/threonine protein kinase